MGQKLEDIRPRRVSLVKRGANLRRILLHKADEEALDGFVADMLAAPVEKEDELLAAVEKTNGDESVAKAMSTLARAADALGDAYGVEVRDAVVKAVTGVLDPDADADVDGGQDDDDLDDPGFCKAYEALLKEDAPTDAQRQEWAKQGIAMPDGSYYIRNRADLTHAIHAIGRGKNNSHADIKAHIVKRARALGATDQLPDIWNISKEDTVTETAQAVPVKKEDGTWDLSAVPENERAAVEAVIKAHDDEVAELRKEKETAETTAEKALAKADALEERISKSDYVEIAKSLDHIAKDDGEFGDLLYAIRKAENEQHLPEGTFEKLETVLKAANELAAPAFREAGRTGGYRGDNDPERKLAAAAAELRKADSSLTKEQSIAKALKNDPDLYDEYQKAVA